MAAAEFGDQGSKCLPQLRSISKFVYKNNRSTCKFVYKIIQDLSLMWWNQYKSNMRLRSHAARSVSISIKLRRTKG